MRVLVVDDEKRLSRSLADYFEPEGLETKIAGDGLAARRMLEEEPFDVVVTDLRMPGLDGMGLLRWMREEGPSVPVIMISAHGEVSDAVEAMKLGAYDYLVKPFDPDELLIRIRKADEGRRTAALLGAGMLRAPGAGRMIGESAAIREVSRLLAKAAPSTATILITGESGTGKEVAALMVHELSGRAGPFVPVNMAAFPEQLLESELFGYEKGAFTGADARKPGLFETANGGTLFLDEIGELPLHLQVKLLRVIQEKKVQRLGAVKGLPVDLRLVAATNIDLESAVRAGKFREDLYYRLNVIRVSLPPLRERGGDVALLAGHFLSRLSTEVGRKISGISPKAMELLSSYPFPGNVRELENAMERAVILAEESTLTERDFSFFSAGGKAGAARAPAACAGADGQPRTLAEIEKEAIVAGLSRNGYLREKTAQELGITRRTLLNKIKEYGIAVPGGEGS